jgi:hypothetical protein
MPSMLNPDQLDILFEKVMQKIYEANRNGSLAQLMADIGWQDILDDVQTVDDHFHSSPKGTIVVLGGSEVKEKHLRGVCKELGFCDKDRFKFYLDYESLKNFKYQNLQWNDSYRLILAGPSPHKTAGTGDFSSAIVAMEKTPGYPKVERLYAGNDLKITKQNFSECLQHLLDSGFLTVS